jgi:H+/Cl- antiporter ClcA
MAESPHAKRWIWTFIGCGILAIAYGVWGAKLFAYIPQVNKKGWAAIVGALIFLTVKFCSSASNKKEYKPHEQGYEATVIAAGAAIPGATVAYVKSQDAFQWLLYAALALVTIFISSAMSRAADESSYLKDGSPSPARISWTLANFFLGVVAFLFYVFLVVQKAQQQ